MTVQTVHTLSKPPRPQASDKPWHAHVNIDMLVYTLNRTILHPFIAFLIPLCLRAQATPYSHPAMISTMTWAGLVTAYNILAIFDYRIANGPARPVDLEEEVVLVTGGASGLGGLIAEIYGMRGISVAVLDVKKPAGENQIEGVEWYECDVSNIEDVQRAKDRVVKDLGVPSIIINCAAAAINGQSLLELSSDAFLRTINVNFISSYNILKTFLPGVLETGEGGTFVTVSSVLAHFCPASLSDYAASKAALSAMHNSLVMELRQSGHKNVKALLVETGQIGTRLFDGLETPSRFLAPVLETREVAKEIIGKIDAGEGGLLRMPFYAGWVSWHGILPETVQLIVRWISQIDTVVAASDIGLNKAKLAEKTEKSQATTNGNAVVQKAT